MIAVDLPPYPIRRAQACGPLGASAEQIEAIITPSFRVWRLRAIPE
jgi:hypothetical protein